MLVEIYYWIKEYFFYCCSTNNNKRNKTKVKEIDVILNTETDIYYDTLDSLKYGTMISSTKSSSVHLYNNYIYKLTHFKNYNELYTYRNNINQLDKNLNILYPLEMIDKDTSLIEKYRYLPNCELFDFIIKYTLTQRDKYMIILSVMESIANLHNSGVAHRDIKPENLFYLPNSKTLLIDLIMCSRYDDPQLFQGGTVSYASPQMFLDTYIENDWRRIDIWSLGVVIYVVQLLVFPWKNSIDCDIYLSYQSNENKQEYWDNIIDNKVISKLLFHTLAIQPEERKNINQLIDIFKNEIDLSTL